MRYSPHYALQATFSNLSALSNLKLSQLRRLLLATGLATTGTKTELLGRLEPYVPKIAVELEDGLKPRAANEGGSRKTLWRHEEKEKTKDAKKPSFGSNLGSYAIDANHKCIKSIGRTNNSFLTGVQKERILSIDMGIQNLAFCVADVETGAFTDKLHVVAWRRISPTSFLPSASLSPLQASSSSGRAPSSLYNSPSLALAAQSLLTRILLPYAPTTILIEKQRFRTGGVAAVQEWTLRVNTLEAALWAVLATLRGGRSFDTPGDGRQNEDVEIDDGIGGIDGVHAVNHGSEVQSSASEAASLRMEITGEMCPSKRDPDVFAVSPARVVGFWSAVLADYNNDNVGLDDEMVTDEAESKSKAKSKAKSKCKSSKIKSERNKHKSPEKSSSSSSSSGDEPVIDGKMDNEARPTTRHQSQNPSKLTDKRAKVMLVKSWLAAGTTSFLAPSSHSASTPATITTTTTTTNPETSNDLSRSLQLTFSPDAQAARKAILGHGKQRKRGKSKDEDDGGDGDGENEGDGPASKAKLSLSASSSSSSSSSSKEVGSKLDDLADCMLQAATWARWRGNERVLRKGDWQSLLRGRMG